MRLLRESTYPPQGGSGSQAAKQLRTTITSPNCRSRPRRTLAGGENWPRERTHTKAADYMRTRDSCWQIVPRDGRVAPRSDVSLTEVPTFDAARYWSTRRYSSLRSWSTVTLTTENQQREQLLLLHQACNPTGYLPERSLITGPRPFRGSCRIRAAR